MRLTAQAQSSPLTLLLLLLLLPLLPLPGASAANCACGYTTPNGAFFTHALETDFLHVRDLARDTNSAWIPQAYNVTPARANGPWGKSSQVRNVVANPLRGDRDTWFGEGVDGGDPGLGLWVRSALENDDGDMIPMSEIVSSRTDILYGSFRIALKPTPIHGTCGAFFFYFNDSTEIDLEFLSKDLAPASSALSNSTVNLVIQSPQSAIQGYVSPASQNFFLSPLSFDATQGYNEFRFDWFPDKVEFYANGQLLRRMEENIPRNQPGALHVSHWSNGNEAWSGGPPKEDAVLMVSYVKGYFNVSSSGTEEWRERCERAEGGEKEVCQVEDQIVAPDPTSGEDGNGETRFWTEQGGNGTGSGEPKAGGAAGRKKSSSSSGFPEAWWLAFVLCWLL
ncbi:glycoside hydrolase family 16 protein [Cercospora zeae-maydis SCOH1-5]|uniref:Glycoside hydrolase family 16 protein n=1 Tax=Cercospora zeae-maydis SCOH1-5 TaxID=717836 RepID=A0A6A6FRV5_9PEZI|nr:glycoside hydrolase family 16 protein [Cercospora zeae-maydis SCOH1-5]